MGQAAQNMMLVAWELGIGSVPATVYQARAIAQRVLAYPDDQHCEFLLSFGYPAPARGPHATPEGRRPAAARRARPSRALVGARLPGRGMPRRLLPAEQARRDGEGDHQPAEEDRVDIGSVANGVPPTMVWRRASARYVSGMTVRRPAGLGHRPGSGRRCPTGTSSGTGRPG